MSDLADAVREGLNWEAHGKQAEAVREALIALRKLEADLERANEALRQAEIVVGAAKAAWQNDRNFPGLVAALREYDMFHAASEVECDGSRFCKADVHIHGCFAASGEKQA